MIFSGDCGLTALVKAWQGLPFRLHSGHFSTVAIHPRLGAKVGLVGHPLAGRWLGRGEIGDSLGVSLR